ncbi:hypothetical protein BD626DRAFT_578577 [Schizophyllum amplum]|uniref:Transcription factor domain-containing protein n=1 Tax=Schizophyllum amplum TaxID=97359 RepID=A0A550BRV3_9AGAR|nr:hypothetical protein BD626DRAFT_578577 [Auriculariopsis ampla]
MRKAMASMGVFGLVYTTLCNLGSCPPSLFETVLQFEQKAWDWFEFMHPMHKNVAPSVHVDIDSSHSEICAEIIGFLHTLPSACDNDQAHTASDGQIRRIVEAHPNVVRYIVDLWCNLFQYYPRPSQGSPARLYDRRYCASMFITSYHLLARPELVPQACPRDTVSSIIAPLLARCRAAEGADEAVLAGCRYLEYLWYCTRDHRTLEWCINDGIFTVALYLASSSDLDDEQTVNELTSVFRMMYRCFVHWRVLYVFERKHAEDLTARRIAEGTTYRAKCLGDSVSQDMSFSAVLQYHAKKVVPYMHVS